MVSGGQSPIPPADEILIKDRASGEIIHRSTIDEGPGVAEVKKAIEDDLERMNLDEFCRTCGIEDYPRRLT